MEMILDKDMDLKISNMIGKFKILNAENIIAKIMAQASKSESIYYVGEYNKADAMF